MSGGSYDYVYHRIEDAADEVDHRQKAEWHSDEARALRAWLAEHLRLVSKAMHDLEWVDSCDYGPGDEVEAIRAVLAHVRASEKESR